MKEKPSQPERAPLWQLAEQARNSELEPAAPPAFEEFTNLSKLMDSLPEFIDRRDVDGEVVESTPVAQFKTLAALSLTDYPKRTRKLVPSVARENGENYTEFIFGQSRIDPAWVDAQVHRNGMSPQLYLTLSIKSVTSTEPQFNQYTVHDGHISDIEEPAKELDDDEVTTVKMALTAVSEKIGAEFEAIDRQRIIRKVGAWWMDSDGSRARRRLDRQSRREIWRNSLGEVGTDL